MQQVRRSDDGALMQQTADVNDQLQSATGATIFEDSDKRQLGWEPGISPVAFKKGDKVRINSGNGALDCRVVDQFYESTSGLPPRLHVVVDVLANSWFAHIDPQGQDFIRMLIAFGIFIVFGTIAYVVYDFNYHPTHFWGFVGYHLRWVGYVAIASVGFGLVITTKGNGQEYRTFTGQVLGLVYTFIMLLMLAGWYYLSTPSKPLITYPDDYAEYVNQLWNQMKAQGSTLLLAAGWLAGVTKIIGWTSWSTVAETLIGFFKKKD